MAGDSPLRQLVRSTLLRLLSASDRLRLRWLCWLHPGLQVDPTAASGLAVARFNLAPDAVLAIGPGFVTERRPGALNFVLHPGAEVRIGADVWLRTEVGGVTIAAYEGARIEIGPDCLLNACSVSAKQRVRLGRRVWVGSGTRIYDADQHDLDDARLEQRAPVELDDYAWIASDVTVLRGARVGAHSVVGARALVTGEIPPHTLAMGSPARPRGSIGDRSRVR